MAIEISPIVESTALPITAGGTLLYTALAAQKVTVTKATITNYGASAATCSFWFLPPGIGSTSSQYLVLSTKSVQPGETFDASTIRGQAVQAGGTIWGFASIATTLAVRITAQVVS